MFVIRTSKSTIIGSKLPYRWPSSHCLIDSHVCANKQVYQICMSGFPFATQHASSLGKIGGRIVRVAILGNWKLSIDTALKVAISESTFLTDWCLPLASFLPSPETQHCQCQSWLQILTNIDMSLNLCRSLNLNPSIVSASISTIWSTLTIFWTFWCMMQ